MKKIEPGKKSFTLTIIVISIILLAGIPATSAFTATLVSPTDINNVHPGDTVTIRIDGIYAGDSFTTQLTSTDLATSGTATFSNFVMPFGFNSGTATETLTTTGIPGITTFSVTDASNTIYTKTGSGSPNTIYDFKPITQQTYKSISISGTPSGSTVGIDYTLGGSAVSAGVVLPATLTFTLNGVNTGNLRILVKQSTTTRLDTTLKIVAVQSAPTVTGISPASGTVLGGTSVNITGTNLTGATAVNFGSTAATSFTVDSATQITATSPAGTAGIVNITVTTSSGTSATSTASQYTYIAIPTVTSISPSSGTTLGGTSVTINGTNFLGATSVKFGTTEATSKTIVSATSITATSPAGTAGIVNITVTTPSGTSATSTSSQYTYRAVTTTTGVGAWRSGTFYRNGATPIAYGLATDTPITGDWNGDRATEVGVFRSGMFYLNGGTPVAYGLATDKPITGDWNGDGTTEVGVFRSGMFYLNGGTSVAYGNPTDTPITGDWNGDGTTEVGVYRSGMFYLNGGSTVRSYGMAGDRPITGDWNGDGTTEIGVWRFGTFYEYNANAIAYGLTTDTPITGVWV